MFRRYFFTAFILYLFTSFIVQAGTFTDNFNASHDYLTEGVTGTGWDGFVGLGAGETVDELNASIDRTGQLYLESTSARWEPGWDPLGPFLYKMVDGDFIAIVRVTEFAGCPTPRLEHNDSGIMARVADLPSAGDGEDAMTVQYFATWSGNIYRIIDNGGEDELGATNDGCSCAPYLQLERAGDTFYMRISQNGTYWTQLSGSPVARTDMSSLPLQVGLWHCTYSNNTGYVAFDDFELVYIPEGSASNPNPADNSDGVEPPVTLSWTGAEEANWHDVYFGDNYSDVNNADNSEPPCSSCIYRARQSSENTSYAVADELLPDQTYYWRIDEIDSEGAVIEKGEVWSFTILGPKAYNPSPSDSAVGVNPFTFLSWQAGKDANSHNVYFGTDLESVENAQRPAADFNGDGRFDNEDLSMFTEKWLLSVEGQNLKFNFDGDTEVTFKDFAFAALEWLTEAGDTYKGNIPLEEHFCSQGILQVNHQYYWRIDEVNFAEPNKVWKGDVWSFETGLSGQINLLNDFFDITMDSANGAWMLLRNPGDANGSNFLLSKSGYPQYDINDSYWLGDLIFHYRLDGGGWQRATTGLSDDVRTFSIDNPTQVDVGYYQDAVNAEGIKNFDLTESWSLVGDELVWEIKVKNRSGQSMDIGDLGVYFPFRSIYDGDTTEIQTNRFVRHDFVSGHGSFLFVNRVSGIEPYLVVTPSENTKLEYFDQIGFMYESIPIMYIHSGITGPATTGTWRQAHTTRTIADGQEITCGFRFQWANDFDGVRDVLYENDQFDVKVVPGMTVPKDLKARVALRTKNTINSVVPEFPSDTTITYVGEPVSDTYVYEIEFSKLGENLITVNYNSDKYMVLEFFVTEGLETLIKKRSAHLIDYQQVIDVSKWYDGLIGPWDMRNQVVRTPDDTDGFDLPWWQYVICTDDSALGHPAFVAQKNAHFPNQTEISGIEYYIENFVWGGLQMTDAEEYPYCIYGVPNWYENRLNDPYHIWRRYDYPHIFMMYHHMYEIAKYYPDMVSYLDKDGYLDRAYGTAYAYFVTLEIIPPSAQRGLQFRAGMMNEVVLLDIIKALQEEGRTDDANSLIEQWDKKVKYFIYDHPYPYVSEFAYDTTAYESSYAIAKWAMENPLEPDPEHPVVSQEDVVNFMQRQHLANIATRGWLEPTYYHMGSDFRGASYRLSYMSQMGGWSVLDYALNYAEGQDVNDFVQLGYASTLSSWALMNTGYWYPGLANDGASGWGFQTRKTGPTWLQGRIVNRGPWYYDGEIELGFSGGIRSACSVVTQDDVFGLFGYGCDVTLSGDDYLIVPKDGLRERLSVIPVSISLQLHRDSYTAAIVRNTADYVSVELENERGTAHTAELTITGLVVGTYSAKVEGLEQFTFVVTDSDDPQTLELSIAAGSDSTITLEKL